MVTDSANDEAGNGRSGFSKLRGWTRVERESSRGGEREDQSQARSVERKNKGNENGVGRYPWTDAAWDRCSETRKLGFVVGTIEGLKRVRAISKREARPDGRWKWRKTTAFGAAVSLEGEWGVKATNCCLRNTEAGKDEVRVAGCGKNAGKARWRREQSRTRTPTKRRLLLIHNIIE